MNESEYLLQSFGLSALFLQDGITDEIIKDVAVKIKELSQCGDISCLIDITQKLLGVVEDVKYSFIWVMLLDGLSNFSHQENVQAIYHHLMVKQAKIFTTGSLPKDILHKLWLTHLPCLESAVLTLVEHICSDEYLPHAGMIQESLRTSLLVEIASREHVIYQTVYRMLMSLVSSCDFAGVIVEITANFCCMVRHGKTKLSFHNELWNTSTQHRNTGTLETLVKLNDHPKGMPTTSIVNTLYKMHQLWTNDRQIATEFPESSSLHGASEAAIDHKFEELWCLTVKYRNLTTAAVNAIFSCDERFVGPCLWMLAAHHQINLGSQKFKPLEESLASFVKGLRELMQTSFRHSELASEIQGLTAKTYHTLESKILMEEKEAHEKTISSYKCVVNQILMTFVFQSDGGLSIGDKLLMLVTSSTDAFVHVRCLIYHYYLLNVSLQEWNTLKYDWFLSLVRDLDLRLEQESTANNVPDFVHLHNELKIISSMRMK